MDKTTLITKLRQNSTETAYKMCWLLMLCKCLTVNNVTNKFLPNGIVIMSYILV